MYFGRSVLRKECVGQGEAVARFGVVITCDAIRTWRVGSGDDLAVQTAQGKPLQSDKALDQALRLAEPEGYVRLFLDEGNGVRQLLKQRLTTGLANDIRPYVDKLLDVMEEESGALLDAGYADTLLELDSLTARERDILKCMADGCSNSEIAASLFLSLGTVKRYSHNIYQKLNVKNRVQAITKARELRLL
ncbi:helix-turn-helix transcriptional regulator [Paenibacillus sp. 1011MAR3C5]|uniref:helix-turn-helix transcriptional regulator n=1 Tax=Paenibacillus sp. 1011MAR3C5 TaxID=1675787 RepID=UPI001601D0C4|nr:helix-turn-helix transcriptional regulator [Paenibacillus sp. 1011MAR3C5]